MGLTNMAKKIKEIHSNDVVIYKSGAFYKVFGKDAYILSSIFDYKINTVENNVVTVGFPIKAITNVKNKLEELKINYMLVDQRNNYDVEAIEDFRNLNNYENEFEKAYKKVKRRKSIQHIAKELELFINRENFKDIIRKIEDIIDENREI